MLNRYVIENAIPSDRFTWSKDGAKDRPQGCAEVSDLPGLSAPFRRVFDDSCDYGFAIRSQRTGKVVVFTVVEELDAVEGDVGGWYLRSLDGAVEVIVFND